MPQLVRSSTGLYSFRTRVPAKLRGVLGWEYKRSLKTHDLQEAKLAYAEELRHYADKLALARARTGGAELLSGRDVHVLASRWYRDTLSKMETSQDFAKYLVERSVWTEGRGDPQEGTELISMREAVDRGLDTDITDIIRGYVNDILRSAGISMPATGSDTHAQLFAVFSEHLLKLSDIALQRFSGDWYTQAVVVPHEPLSVEMERPKRIPEGKKLLTVFEEYAGEKRENDGNVRGVEKTIASYRAVVEQFVQLTGIEHIGEVSRDTIRSYREAIAKLPAKGEGIRALGANQLIAKAEAEGLPRITAATTRNKLRAVSAMFSYAVRLALVAENPVIAGGFAKAAAKAATKRSALTRRRRHYTHEELALIFKGPLHSGAGWAPPRADFGKAWYWLPLLFYYTGARREELTQLAAKDVLNTDGIWNLSILAAANDDDAGRGVKNEGSRRFIPLHPDLLALGFCEYVASVPTGGQLFPLLEKAPDGYFGRNFGKLWDGYLKKVVGLESSAGPAHGFRHTFKTLCREVGIGEDVHDAITGHAGHRTAARDYGVMPLSRMAEEIARFPSAPLPVAPELFSQARR